MTEELKPKGTPYGLAMALLHEFADTLPAAVVLLPDHVLWPSDSQALTAQTFQILDEAAAVLSALHAQHVPATLLLAKDSMQLVKTCLEEANLLDCLFSAVVEYDPDPPSQPQAQPGGQQQQQQPPAAGLGAAASSSSWMRVASSIKSNSGVPWEQTLLFCSAAAVDAARLANKLGMACVRVPAASGLNVACLRQGLETYASKLESDRGY